MVKACRKGGAWKRDEQWLLTGLFRVIYILIGSEDICVCGSRTLQVRKKTALYVKKNGSETSGWFSVACSVCFLSFVFCEYNSDAFILPGKLVSLAGLF